MGVRGPSPGSYRPDWSWKPSKADKLAMQSIKNRSRAANKAAADYMKSLPRDEREELLAQLKEELSNL